jgi:tRNA pseudouridine65 synthase
MGKQYDELLTIIMRLDELLSTQPVAQVSLPPLDILYQDEYLVAIHKPAGLLVHRSMIDKHETQFAMQMLRDQIGQHVYPVHRLDRPTSGVLVFALSSDIARLLTEQFTAKLIDKTYFAIVRGHAQETGHIDYALKEKLDKIADKKAKQDKPAQSAVTDYQTLVTFEHPFPVGRYQSARYSLVKLVPLTGRKHQLRRHMSHINHPILGDTTHGDGKHNSFVRQQFDFQGLALTCLELALTHPVNQNRLVLRTEFDQRMAKLLKIWDLTPSQLENLITQ